MILSNYLQRMAVCACAVYKERIYQFKNKLDMKNKQSNTTEKGMAYDRLLATKPCLNCKETVKECACIRNICHKCGKPVGNITFKICDECWDIEFPPKK